MISTHEADRVLLHFAGIAEEHEQRFLERLRQLRRFGVPSGVPRGRGVASGRSFEQMLETALAIRLLDAGLASSDVARLVRQEWVLARSVMMLIDSRSAATEWPDGRPTAVYWIASPSGLAAYQGSGVEMRRTPKLETHMLFEGERLEGALSSFRLQNRDPAIVINAGQVALDLVTSYSEAGIPIPI